MHVVKWRLEYMKFNKYKYKIKEKIRTNLEIQLPI